MYISSFSLFAWSLITFAYILLSARYRRLNQHKDDHIRELERTIEKLRSKNGKLWYDLINNGREERAALERTELTITTKLAT